MKTLYAIMAGPVDGPCCPRCGNRDLAKIGATIRADKRGIRYHGPPCCMACGFVEEIPFHAGEVEERKAK